MAYRYRNSPNQRLCRIGASLLIVAHAGGSLADVALPAAAVAQRSPATVAAPGEAAGRECAAALRRSLERVPELLALADWPLDSLPPAACRHGGGAPPAVAAAAPATAVPVAAPVTAPLAAASAVAAAMPVSLEAPLELLDAGAANQRQPAQSASVVASMARPAPAAPLPAPGAASVAAPVADASAPEAALTAVTDQAPVVLVIAGGADAPVSARDWVEETVAAPAPFALAAALGYESLDEIRGGFEPADSQLKFSFGIERAVFINGELVTTTVLNLRDLQWTSGVGPAPEAATSGIAGAVGIIQNGGGNAVPAQIGANLAGTVIQNTLDNQAIQTVTTVNAAVNSAQILRAMSVQSAVQNGLINSLRH